MHYLTGVATHPDELIITDTNYQRFSNPHRDASGTRAMGLVPRNWDTDPQGSLPGEVGMHAVEDLPSFDPSDFPKLIKLQMDEGNRLSDFRAVRGPDGGMIPARDQNGQGYCWRYSASAANLLLRAVQDAPYVDLSPHAGACMIKNFRDEGGWGAQGLDDVMRRGDPSSEFWPQKSMSRANDRPETWENAKLHRITEGFIDLAAPQYDRKLTVDQMITCLLCNIPVITDFNWWGHSACAMDPVDGVAQWGYTRAESGKLMSFAEFNLFWGVDTLMRGIAIRILNSWGQSWSTQGAGLLTGNRAVPNGATAPRLATFTPRKLRAA